MPTTPLGTLDGRWLCRTVKLGGLLPLVIYGYFKCEIADQVIRKTIGSQRFSGRLYVAGEEIVFLGASEDGDQEPIAYGADPDRDMIGVLRALGPDHLALELPSPRYESHHDIIEFVRETPSSPDRSAERDPSLATISPPAKQ